MIDIAKGRYWDLPWSLVSGCTRCSPGCDNCWSLAMEKRFHKGIEGQILTHPERLAIPLKRKKPTVYAVWNDFWHESVPDDFQYKAYEMMPDHHTFLILTKRPHIAAAYYAEGKHEELLPRDNIWHGLTVCNQQEADEKIPVFLQVPGKKFLSIEPMLGALDLTFLAPWDDFHVDALDTPDPSRKLNAVILGGETGPGARPMHPDWVRSVRDQCAAAGVPFFFKGWGQWLPSAQEKDITCSDIKILSLDGKLRSGAMTDKEAGEIFTCRMKSPGRLLDGRTHDDLPWVER